MATANIAQRSVIPAILEIEFTRLVAVASGSGKKADHVRQLASA